MPPYNGSGTYVRPAGQPVVAGTDILDTTFNTYTADVATALTDCVTRDGQSPATANLPMGGFKLTGLAAATGAGDAVRYEQVVALADLAGTTHAATEKVTLVDADEFPLSDSAATYGLKKTLWSDIKTTLANTFTSLSQKDATGGYAGLTLFKINFKNAANTFTSFFTNSNTAARTYTFQDRDGTIADLTDVAGLSTATTKLPTIGCTQGTGALTFSASSIYLDFRSTTLTSGTPSTVLAAPSSLVLPSGGTLGAVTTVSARIIVVEMNNAGTAELAIVNIAGGVDLSETGLISTKAITDACTVTGSIAVTTGILTLTTALTGTLALGMALSGTNVTSGTVVLSLLTGTLGANGSTYQTNQFTAAASTTITGGAGLSVYSTTSRTNLAYRVVGSVDAVNTAGAWGNPTLVQGAGGNSMTAMSSLGYGQTWQNVAGSRVSGTTYYNTTGKPIEVVVAFGGGLGYISSVVVNGTQQVSATIYNVCFIVPPGGSYSVIVGTMGTWVELR